MMRFDRFTEQAQDAAMRAYEVLQRYGHAQVDTEHLLLAMFEQPMGRIPELLKQMGVDLESVRGWLHRELKRTPRTQIYGGDIKQVYITPRLKKVIDRSNEESFQREVDYVSTEHLLLAIASERRTPAARLLREQGITRKRILEAMVELDAARDRAEPLGRKPPSSSLVIDRVVGESPELILSQGDNQVHIPLQDAMKVIARLADAAAVLATLQGE